MSETRVRLEKVSSQISWVVPLLTDFKSDPYLNGKRSDARSADTIESDQAKAKSSEKLAQQLADLMAKNLGQATDATDLDTPSKSSAAVDQEVARPVVSVSAADMEKMFGAAYKARGFT